MFWVKKELCVACGLCVENCPRGAISLLFTQARIDQSECSKCGLCFDICPQKAIVKLILTPKDDLKNTVLLLKQKADELTNRIERLGGHKN